mmetsp:Transcript_11073/g.21430  ORF Transcript_11073/g.21430 Transcript_11073/m.21430 type:complete len:511 (+) Transcript_11073:61-1593(+)
MASVRTAAGFVVLGLASAIDVPVQAARRTGPHLVPLSRKARFPDVFGSALSGTGLAASNASAKLSGGFHEQQPLLNWGNVQYLGSFGLGTPPQSLQLLIDTGSSDLWVRSSAFQPDHSSTAQFSPKEVRISYGQGSVAGSVVSDSFQIGGVNVTNQEIMIPQQEHGMASVNAAGVLGLAWPGLSHTGETVMQHLEAEENISAFALLLTGTDEGSYFALGMPESSWYNNESLVWTDARTDLWWAVDGSLHIEGSSLELSGLFLLDSGTSFIGAPDMQFELLVNQILPRDARSLCKVMQPSGIRYCSCDVLCKARSMQVHIGGVEFPVGPAALFGQVDDKNTCVLQVMRLQDGMPLILGDSFLRTVAAIFDVRGRRIGLAKRYDNLPLPQEHPDWKRMCLGACSLVCFVVSVSALCYLLFCDHHSGKAMPAAAGAAGMEAEAEANLRPAELSADRPPVLSNSEVSTEDACNVSDAQKPHDYSIISLFYGCVSHRRNISVANEATSDAPYQRL